MPFDKSMGWPKFSGSAGPKSCETGLGAVIGARRFSHKFPVCMLAPLGSKPYAPPQRETAHDRLTSGLTIPATFRG
jgi:hypothetical protein